ncbi:MAG: hypothetical protein KKA22_04690 [Gammaproteobacteria bacterium]|nr:hypothetical protein [Gammaproteobacteria bacterium]MBU1407428.1 hypothetical protein [Gammaproteobacteria bacterium]MBU1531541.1 hypothetical protein [Gammaproteobacteria bacterium]
MRNDILAKVSLAGRLGSLIALPFLLIAGNAPAATLPGRLAEVPDNERALGEIHGNNEPDAAAWHAARMAKLENAPVTLPILIAQAGGGSPASGISAEERARKDEWRKRYFSPEARAKLQEEMAAGNGPAGTASLHGPASSDPSIDKAKAAGVDTRVFGVPLGEPLRLPRCHTANERKNEQRSNDPMNPLKNVDLLGAFRGVQTSFTCQSEGALMAFIGALAGGKPADRYIMLAKDSCPEWAYCEVAASLHDGNLVGITVLIQKGARGDYIAKQLRAKYGKPTRREEASYQNQYGASYQVENLEWRLPGLHVAFGPGPDGGGLLLVETETGYKNREAKGAAEEARQPKL